MRGHLPSARMAPVSRGWSEECTIWAGRRGPWWNRRHSFGWAWGIRSSVDYFVSVLPVHLKYFQINSSNTAWAARLGGLRWQRLSSQRPLLPCSARSLVRNVRWNVAGASPHQRVPVGQQGQHCHCGPRLPAVSLSCEVLWDRAAQTGSR